MRLRKIPRFKSEKEERKFWQSVDSTKYVDYKTVQNWQFANLKLTSKPITIRLPQTLIERLKIKAHQMDIPYQTLIKKFIFDSLVQ